MPWPTPSTVTQEAGTPSEPCRRCRPSRGYRGPGSCGRAAHSTGRLRVPPTQPRRSPLAPNTPEAFTSSRCPAPIFSCVKRGPRTAETDGNQPRPIPPPLPPPLPALTQAVLGQHRHPHGHQPRRPRAGSGQEADAAPRGPRRGRVELCKKRGNDRRAPRVGGRGVLGGGPGAPLTAQQPRLHRIPHAVPRHSRRFVHREQPRRNRRHPAPPRRFRGCAMLRGAAVRAALLRAVRGAPGKGTPRGPAVRPEGAVALSSATASPRRQSRVGPRRAPR